MLLLLDIDNGTGLKTRLREKDLSLIDWINFLGWNKIIIALRRITQRATREKEGCLSSVHFFLEAALLLRVA